MKNLLLSMHFMATLLCPFAMNAQTQVSFTINIDRPEGVTCTVGNVEQSLVAGDNAITAAEATPLLIAPKEGYVIKGGTDPSGSSLWLNMNGAIQGYVYSYWEGKTMTVEVVTEDEMYPLSCTITVDDPSKISAYMATTFRQVNLVAGEQTVRFNEQDNVMYVNAVSMNDPIYQITQNGTVLENTQYYEITLADGDNIDIQANYPDVNFNVKFEFVNPGTEPSLNKLWIDGEAIDDIASYLTPEGFDLKWNTQIQISFDTENYKINGVKLNDADLDFYVFRISEPSVIKIDTRLWQHPVKNVYITGADNISLYHGYSSWSGIPVEIHEGLNEIVVDEDFSFFSVYPNRDCYLTELTLGDTDMLQTWTPEVPYFDFMPEGDVHISASAYEFDKSFVLYIDNIAAADFGFGMIDANGLPIDNINSGYNTVAYYDLISPFEITAMSMTSIPVMYLNDELYTENHYNDYSWALIPAGNDVYKMFIGSTPEKFDYTITNDESAEVTITRDLIVPVTDFSAPLSLLPGTQIDLTAPEGKTVMVSVDGAEAVEMSEYTTTAHAGGSIEITKVSGIESISADAVTRDASVYNLQGIKVATSDSFDTLPAGIYIIGGQKVMKK